MGYKEFISAITLYTTSKKYWVYLSNGLFKKKFKMIDCVYDLTIGYIDTIPQNESAIFKGFPKEFHVHLERYPIENLPENDKDLEKWLSDRWYEKDSRLEQFYKNGKFTQRIGTTHKPLHSPDSIKTFSQLQAIFWFILLIIVIYLFTEYSVFFWFTVISWIVLQVISVYSGLEIIEMKLWSHKPQNISQWVK